MNMSVKWVWELEDGVPEGAVFVIADVYAATTNIVTLLGRNIEKLLIVNDQNVKQAKAEMPEALVIGESMSLPPNFFNSSNYPFALEDLDVRQKTILYMSVNGSGVVETAFEHHPAQVLTVSFINLLSVATYLTGVQDKPMVFVASGNKDFADKAAEEDMLCLLALKKKIENIPFDDEEYLWKAEGAVRLHYSSRRMSKDMEIVFQSRQSPIIPVCEKLDNNMILVTPLKQ
jgi:phosphosulfolactate phosphohydrolase-like enzyme